MKLILNTTIILHHIIIWALVICGVLTLNFEPFYVSFPILIFIGVLGTDINKSCILTRIENKYRKKLGKPEISGFIKHYYIRGML